MCIRDSIIRLNRKTDVRDRLCVGISIVQVKLYHLILIIMDTNLTLELFIGRGMIDKSLAKDIKEEMTVSGKELPEVLADFGIIGSKDDIWQKMCIRDRS